MTLHARLLAIFSPLVLLPAQALADWQADVHMRVPPKISPTEIDGKAFGMAGAVRVDFQGPRGPMSLIIDLRKRVLWTLVHNQKELTASSLDPAAIDVPSCDGAVLKDCLSKAGFTNLKEGVSLDNALFTPPDNYHAPRPHPVSRARQATIRPAPDESDQMREELLNQGKPFAE